METAADLIAAFRDEASDKVKPYLWSDDWLLNIASEAEREACRRAHLLVDSSASFCSVSVSANDPLIDIDPLILDIRRAKLSISTYQLTPVKATEMDALNPGWEKHVGTPTSYVTDYQTNAIRLYPNQQVACELNMSVSRLPLKSMASEDDKPEIRIEYRQGLVQWMLYRAYSKVDADGFNKAQADMALARFEREFGQRSSARNERWKNERPVIETPTIA